jgi:hypothetical protein
VGIVALLFAYSGSAIRAQQVMDMDTPVHHRVDTTQTHSIEPQRPMASQAAKLKLRIADMKAAHRLRLAGKQLQICQQRQARIEQHAVNATKHATAMSDTFAQIADRVLAFQDEKGILVENSIELVADVEAKRASVDSAVQQANQVISVFDCQSDGPKAQLQQFVGEMDNVRHALKAYRQSIKNLIQGVRLANGQHRQASGSAEEAGL